MSNFIVKDGKISQENNQLLGKKRKIVENDITKTIYNLNKNPEIFKLLNNKENEIISRGIEYKLSHTLKGENIINDLTDKTKISKEETKNFIFNEDLMNSLMNWKSSSSIGKGLINLGNTCFLNSVLQSILYTPIIKNYLYLTNHKSICKSKNVCFLCELQKLYLETGIIKLIKENSRNSNVNYNGITPKGIIQNLKIISKNIKKGRQEDAHEFLLYLLDALENSVKQFLLSLNIKNHNFIRNEKLYRDNLISQIFGGKLKSSVVCQNCKESSDKYDNFIDLSLVFI